MDLQKQAEYAKAAALCVELALNSVECDIRTELERSSGPTTEVLNRLLARVHERQKAIHPIAAPIAA